MTTEALRIRVAELCGWKRHDVMKDDKFFLSDPKWSDPFWYGKYPEKHVPNYPSDLNACSEFEKTLTLPEFESYEAILGNFIGHPVGSLLRAKAKISAAAEQRCRAFVKVKEGK